MNVVVRVSFVLDPERVVLFDLMSSFVMLFCSVVAECVFVTDSRSAVRRRLSW